MPRVCGDAVCTFDGSESTMSAYHDEQSGLACVLVKNVKQGAQASAARAERKNMAEAVDVSPRFGLERAIRWWTFYHTHPSEQRSRGALAISSLVVEEVHKR